MRSHMRDAMRCEAEALCFSYAMQLHKIVLNHFEAFELLDLVD